MPLAWAAQVEQAALAPLPIRLATAVMAAQEAPLAAKVAPEAVAAVMVATVATAAMVA